MKTDYQQTGIPYDKPATRIRRMEEAIKIIKSMWKKETSFNGKHYNISQIPKSPSQDGISSPPVLIGGGGKMLLSVAGRHADIVSIISGLPEGKFTQDFYRRGVMDGYHKRIGYVRDAALKAGRKFDDIELSVCTTHTEISDDSESVYRDWAKSRGLTLVEAKAIPTMFVGSVEEIKEQLFAFRDATGVNYFVLGLPSMYEIREFGVNIVKDMTGK